MNAVFATGRNEVQRTLRRRMAITYNDLFLDIRRELKQGGVIDTTLEARELTCFGVEQDPGGADQGRAAVRPAGAGTPGAGADSPPSGGRAGGVSHR